jgi:signal transduction histidine kinase
LAACQPTNTPAIDQPLDGLHAASIALWHQASSPTSLPPSDYPLWSAASRSTDTPLPACGWQFDDPGALRAALQGRQSRGLGYGVPSLSIVAMARRLQRADQLQDRFASQLQKEKLKSLRQFAYGLSHEINNPLANIATRGSGLVASASSPQVRIAAQSIVQQAMRAHEMIADAMLVAQPPAPKFAACNLLDLVKEVVEQWPQTEPPMAARKSIDIRVRTKHRSEAAVLVDADAVQVREALRALLRNAWESIESQGAIQWIIFQRGDCGIVEVCDNGPGLSAEARAHAFDPYYSGREAGRGLGLGLSKAHTIAVAHRGSLRFRSCSVGCRIQFAIPRHNAPRE